MIINERDLRHQSVVEAAHRMMTAARTAPKAKGVDIIEIALVEEREDLEKLAEAMRRRSEETGFKFPLRDADNILQGEAVILIGTRRHTQGLNCGYCGYSACVQNPAQNPCALNSIDVGIAIGSACSVAADLRIDTRVLFSAGWASEMLPWLPGCSQTIAIALSAFATPAFVNPIEKDMESGGTSSLTEGKVTNNFPIGQTDQQKKKGTAKMKGDKVLDT